MWLCKWLGFIFYQRDLHMCGVLWCTSLFAFFTFFRKLCSDTWQQFGRQSTVVLSFVIPIVDIQSSQQKIMYRLRNKRCHDRFFTKIYLEYPSVLISCVMMMIFALLHFILWRNRRWNSFRYENKKRWKNKQTNKQANLNLHSFTILREIRSGSDTSRTEGQCFSHPHRSFLSLSRSCTHKYLCSLFLSLSLSLFLSLSFSLSLAFSLSIVLSRSLSQTLYPNPRGC